MPGRTLRAPGKVLIGLGAIAGVAIIGFTLSGPGRKGPEPASHTGAAEPNSPAPLGTDLPPSSQQPQQPLLSTRPNEAPAAASAASVNLITNWEDRVDEILVAEGATEAKAKQMLEMFPRLPEAGQVEVAKHLSNLLPDQDYAPLGQLLANPHLPEDVLETLMADVMNRRNGLKLPALLGVARTAQHPKAADAKEVLGFFLETDYGDDWAKWGEKVQEWLNENPD